MYITCYDDGAQFTVHHESSMVQAAFNTEIHILKCRLRSYFCNSTLSIDFLSLRNPSHKSNPVVVVI